MQHYEVTSLSRLFSRCCEPFGEWTHYSWLLKEPFGLQLSFWLTSCESRRYRHRIRASQHRHSDIVSFYARNTKERIIIWTPLPADTVYIYICGERCLSYDHIQTLDAQHPLRRPDAALRTRKFRVGTPHSEVPSRNSVGANATLVILFRGLSSHLY